ncbi:MAG: M3 family metallopeptidase [Candidatus Marinimicrobia bacterium]|nr:M3 family metallopeptidase [Candidatus Neomarinimicrobiota bacterium]
MKKSVLMMAGVSMLAWSCSTGTDNPLLIDYGTPYDIPPFDKITEDHYLPAVEAGMAEQLAEIDSVISNTEAPTFENTIEALEFSGTTLDRVTLVFYNLEGANTNDRMQELARQFSPMLSGHNDKILLNDELFQRVKVVWDDRADLDLNTEQSTLLSETYKAFARNGALLNEQQKAELMEINKELASLSTNFGENILAENNKFELVIEDQAELAGLPEGSIVAATEAAKERDHDGKWVFTLHKPSLIPFLQYSDMREYREKMFKGYIMRGDNGDEHDNNDIAAKMASLRAKRANLLGYPTHAHYVLEENMAKTPEAVYDLLNKLWIPALAKAKREAAEFQEMIDAEGGDFKLEAWDWWYYAEKVKKARYDLDNEQLRPYFEVENVIQGAFEVANKLWGLTIKERFDLPKYHEDVRTFEVKDKDSSHLGIFLVDYYPRASKGGGAWMNSFRKQSRPKGVPVTPVIYNVGNFTKPTAEKPALLTFEEVETLFHEFGHALHGFLSNCTYNSLSGTSVPRDFVEVPSQVMENWAAEPEVMKSFARHYETGEPIPDELIAKIKAAGTFNQGFKTGEYLAASFLDMDWHSLTDSELRVPDDFEDASMARIGLIPEIVSRYRSQYFAHIFAGGYASGYYGYIWSEVLDADAFQAFKETGDIFDPATAQSLRDNVFSRGGTEEPMVLYKRFRGREPEIEPLLISRGLN